MVTLQEATFWISPDGGLYQGETHLDLLDEIYGEGEGESDTISKEIDDEYAAIEALIAKGWIRGVVGGIFGEYSERGSSIGFQAKISALQRQEGFIEELIRDNNAETIHVDIENTTESVTLNREDLDRGFIKAIGDQRRIIRMRIRSEEPVHRRPRVNIKVRGHRRRA